MSLNPTKLVLGLLGPFITAGSGLLCAAVAKYGVHLDPSGINALGVAGATAGVTLVVKLIHDVESKNPKAVAEGQTAVEVAKQTVAAAVKVDPQLEQAAKQAVSVAEQKVEEVAADAWPADPVPVAPAPVPPVTA